MDDITKIKMTKTMRLPPKKDYTKNKDYQNNENNPEMKMILRIKTTRN